ncbi:MAG: hypothetical protein RIQ46_433 [Pseudomonadota bacterium]
MFSARPVRPGPFRGSARGGASVSRPLLALPLLAVLTPAFASPAVAQTVAAPTREELRAVPPEAEPRANAARLSIEGGVERGPCPLAEPSLAGLRMTFSKVRFDGLSAVDPALLEGTWQDMAGQDLPLASLCDVRDRAATALRAMGYLAAVQVPPQRIEKGGEVRMDVLVARLVEVQARGETGHGERLIAAHLDQLAARPWFNLREAERHLLLLGDLPGYDVRLTLRPAGKAPGEVIGDVMVTRQPVELVAGVQNLGSRATGREGAFARLVLNDVTGMGDRTAISLFNTFETREQTVVQLAHDLALGADGLRFAGSLVWGHSRPAAAGGRFRSETLIGNIALSWPLLRRQSRSLSVSGGLELADQSVDFAGTRLSKDRLRIAYARLDYEAIAAGSLVGAGGYSASEPRWRLAGAIEARQGLSALGASKDCAPIANCLPPRTALSDLTAKPAAFVLRAEGTFEYRPSPRLAFVLSPRAQYSPDRLLGFEQYSLGNYTIGRGLDPGTVMGDNGLGGSLELRLGQLRPRTDKSLVLQPYAFLDAAWAWANDGGITADPSRVTSAGGGVRLRWGDRIDANLLLAAPLERAGLQTRRGDLRVLFTLAARLLPWSQR